MDFRRKSGPRLISVEQLALSTKTDSIIFECLKVAYRWTGDTRLQKENFIRLRDQWLRGSAKED